MYFKPLFIRIDQSILDIQVVAIPNIYKLINAEPKEVWRIFKSNNLPVIFSKKYIAFLPVAKDDEENLEKVKKILRPLIVYAKNRKMKSNLREIIEAPEFMSLGDIIDVSDRYWRHIVAILKKSFLSGFRIRRLLNDGNIANDLMDPKSGVSFNVALLLKFLRVPPVFPITIVCRPKATGRNSGEKVILSKRGKSLVLLKFEEFKSKLRKISFYIGGTKIDLSKAEEFGDIIHLKDSSIGVPESKEVPIFLEVHPSVIGKLHYSSTIKRLYHHGKEELEGRPFDDLQRLLPYDLSFKNFEKIRMIFAVSSSENKRVKDSLQRFHDELMSDPDRMLRFLGDSKKIKDFLDLEIVGDPIEFSSIDDLINDLKQVARPLSAALNQKEADIIIVGTSAYRASPLKSGAQEKYDAIRKKLLENGYANQFISYYSGSESPLGLLAQFESGSSSYEYSLGNLMLNIYSKVSGKPWVVRQDKSSAAHAIIALGFARSKDNKFGIGVSLIIDEYGNLLQVRSWNLSDSVLLSKNLYVEKEKMRKIILNIVREIERDKNYLSRINLIVYKYGRYSEDELQGMRDAIDEVGSSELRISPISIQKESVYPYSTTKYVRLTNRSVLFSPLKNAYASVAILWPLGNNYDFYSSLQNVVNNIEALLRLHWQTLWSKIRRLSILKAANKIAQDLLKGYSLPSDPALIKTPWFI